ncbi:MAG: integrase [Rhodobacteraceae bacterium]|nr:integrase [Paracoccaceae bacterium]
MSPHIKYAYLRHNTWVYRRTYPKRLQPILGSALKQSLKTSDARTAKARVVELNTLFERIITEADHHATDLSAPEAVGLGVARPRYQRCHLLGDRPVGELIEAYLSHKADRLRTGSFKSIRYAMALLASHVGAMAVGALTAAEGRRFLSYLSCLSPNIRKYRVARGKGLAELATLSGTLERQVLAPQTQRRVWEQVCGFLDWVVETGELSVNPWSALKVGEPPEPVPHSVLTDDQVVTLLKRQDRALQGALLFGLLTGLRSGEIIGLMAEDIVAKGNLGRFLTVRPNAVRMLKTKAAEREVPLHAVLEGYIDRALPKTGRLFPHLTVDRVVKLYAKQRQLCPELRGTVFHSTRKWFITQCERTGVPEHYTASLVGHHSARSQNRLTYGLYSAGISDAQKREIIDVIRLPATLPPEVLGG